MWMMEMIDGLKKRRKKKKKRKKKEGVDVMLL